MGNSVQHDLGCGYDPLQGHAPSGPPVLRCQYEGGKVYTFRVQDQAKQTTHSGPPPFSISFFEEQSFGNTGPQGRKEPRDPRLVTGTSSRPACNRITQLKLEVGQRESD
jgi:hypothetical protein